MIVDIQDYILRRRTKRRMMELAEMLELTPDEVESLTSMITEPLPESWPEPDEFPFDMQMPDGEIVTNRDELEEW